MIIRCADCGCDPADCRNLRCNDCTKEICCCISDGGWHLRNQTIS